MIGALVLLGAALLVVPGMLTGSPETTPRSSSAPTVTPEPATPTSAATLGPSGYTSVSWSTVLLGDGGGEAHDAVAFGDRIVVVGEDATGPMAWTSNDGGETWSSDSLPADLPPVADATASAQAVAVIGDRLAVAGRWLGGQTAPPILWLSDDRGASWRDASTEVHMLNGSVTTGTEFTLVPRSLVSGTPGLLTYALDTRRGGTDGLWISPDGMAWTQLPGTGLPFLAGANLQLGAGPDGFVAAGSHAHELGLSPAAWVSADGIGWSVGMDDPQVLGAILQADGGPAGYAATGQTFRDARSAAASELGLATLWRSADGNAWESLLLAGIGTLPVGMAMNGAGTLVAVRPPSSDGPAAIVFVANGSSTVTSVDPPFGPGLLASIGDQFLAAGGCGPNADCQGTLVSIGTPTR